MQNNKRGLSDLVSNVLIILLVFASIAIMGVIILNLVKLSGDSIENAAACKQINVKPVQCIHNVTDANLLFSTEYDTGIVLKEVDTVAVFSDGTTANQSILGSVLGNFETQSVREDDGDGINKNYDKFYTITSFTDKKGIDRVCVSDKIGCTLYTPTSSSGTTGGNTNSGTGGQTGSDGGSSGSSGGSGGGGGLGNPTVCPASCSANQVCSSATGNICAVVSPPVNGVCGSTLDGCTSGTFREINDNATHHLWGCTGAGSGSTNASCSILRSQNSNNFLLTLNIVGDGNGTVEISSIGSFPGSITCNQQLCTTYIRRTGDALLVATGNATSTLTGWTGCAYVDQTDPSSCRINMNSDKTVSANFSKLSNDAPTDLRLSLFQREDEYTSKITLQWKDNLQNELRYVVDVYGEDQTGAICSRESLIAGPNIQSISTILPTYLEQKPSRDENNFCDYSFKVQGIRADGTHTAYSNQINVTTSP